MKTDERVGDGDASAVYQVVSLIYTACIITWDTFHLANWHHDTGSLLMHCSYRCDWSELHASTIVQLNSAEWTGLYSQSRYFFSVPLT